MTRDRRLVPPARASLAPRALASRALLALALLAPARARAGETTHEIMGQVPEDSLDHFFVPFDVPPGTVEIEIAHDDLSADNVLDWGLLDPDGAFRGWGGGNSENAIVGEAAASRSYVPGPILPGTWRVVVGKAKIAQPPGQYLITVTLRDVATLPPQPERAPYRPGDLGGGPRWYAGDFHVHSRESGDAAPDLDAIADFARSRGLDFVVVNDHNTIT
ncbi:MAG TPA: PHP domain-containing protein, partial [Nannocystis sp.]